MTLFARRRACLLAFVPVEARVRNPMLDPAYVRTPIVRAALFAAFAVYFGVFAIFFLTALYLDIALHYSGWRLAGMFAPMAAAIVVGGLLAGPWVARSGSRLPMVVGCASPPRACCSPASSWAHGAGAHVRAAGPGPRARRVSGSA